MTRASLPRMRAAVDAAHSYVRYGGVELRQAVDVVCDELQIPAEDDRRIVTNALERRISGRPATIERAAG